MEKMDDLQQQIDALNTAIDYALDISEDGLEWLRAWREGDPDAIAEACTALSEL